MLVSAALAVAVLGTGVGVVYVKHQARKTYVELRALESERDRMRVEWGQLELEESTWATHDRVQKLARTRLGLHRPATENVVVVTP